MMNTILLGAILVFVSQLHAQPSTVDKLTIIPEPVSVIRPANAGYFKLSPTLSLIVPKNDEVKKIVAGFSKQVSQATGYRLTTREGIKAVVNSFSFLLVTDKTIPGEGYRLKVTKTGISITANKAAGIFYGIQTLLQLFPPDVLNKIPNDRIDWPIPVVTI